MTPTEALLAGPRFFNYRAKMPSDKPVHGSNFFYAWSSKPRPGCRKAILSYLREQGIDLMTLWARMQAHPYQWSDGLRKECRRMVCEYITHKRVKE